MDATNGIMFFLFRWQTTSTSPGVKKMATLRAEQVGATYPICLGRSWFICYPSEIMNTSFHSQNHYGLNKKKIIWLYRYNPFSHPRKECPEIWIFCTRPDRWNGASICCLFFFFFFTKFKLISFFFFWSVWSMIIWIKHMRSLERIEMGHSENNSN